MLLLLAFTLFVILMSRIRLYFLINGLKPVIIFNGLYILIAYYFYKRRRLFF